MKRYPIVLHAVGLAVVALAGVMLVTSEATAQELQMQQLQNHGEQYQLVLKRLDKLMTEAALADQQEKGPSKMPSGAELIEQLKADHPRIIATTDDFAKARELVKQHEHAKAWMAEIRQRGTNLLEAAPSQYEIPDGKRLLRTSRRVVSRIYDLALLYRLDGDRKWAERAWLELETAANFKDWNPSHFLDTAEMAHAFAIGYDWLYDVWSPEQREVLRKAMVRHALEPALVVYEGEGRHHKWHVSRHNWNQVCNGGIGLAALAIGDEVPELAGRILDGALKSLPLAMASYAPQGAWFEGPGYWHYATRYTVYFLAGLEKAVGSDLGFSQAQGFSETGNFMIDMISPTGRSFNFADVGSDNAPRAEEMLWLAKRFNRPELVDYVYARPGPHPLEVIWLSRIVNSDMLSSKPSLPPLARHYKVTEVVTARTAWNDPKALWVGLKAGSNKVNHSNLDLGSFVFEAAGQRWAVDPGADNYNMPGYFDFRSTRWTYYRLRAEGHNTLVINPDMEADQDPNASADIAHFETEGPRTTASVDLTQAYARHAEKVVRKVKLDETGLRVEDELTLKAAGEVWWFMHTRAEVEVAADGRSAVLTQEGARLTVKLVEPAAGTRLTVMDAAPLPGTPNPEMQNKNQGLRKLAIQLKDFDSGRIVVVLEPLKQ